MKNQERIPKTVKDVMILLHIILALFIRTETFISYWDTNHTNLKDSSESFIHNCLTEQGFM